MAAVSAAPDEAIIKAAELVENQFGVGLYLEVLRANGVNWSTQAEQDALVKMGQHVLANRPEPSDSSIILKTAASVLGQKGSREPQPINVDGIVDNALAHYPELEKAAETYLDGLLNLK